MGVPAWKSQLDPLDVNPDVDGWLSGVQSQMDSAMGHLLEAHDEAGLDPDWTLARGQVREYALRPAKRLRPALFIASHGLMSGREEPSGPVWQFAAGLELMHTFLLIHDDVADQAEVRRGGPSLHRMLGGANRLGQDMAVVAGDHLFSRSVEVMLGSGLPRAPAVVSYLLSVCRHTAAGQFMDLELSRLPLSRVTLSRTLKVANLKTAQYGFVAPLVCGAMLAGANSAVLDLLERLGRKLGLSYQLRDDLIGLFGDVQVAGKPVDSDLMEGKRTFPVIAAYQRADEEDRRDFDAMWVSNMSERDLPRARRLIEKNGGRAATQRIIHSATRSARKGLRALPPGKTAALLDLLIDRLAERES